MPNFNLSDPFPPEDIEWRIQRGGFKKNGEPWAMVLAYVTNRAIMDRLDDVVGPQGWKNEFLPGPGGGIICGLSIKFEDEWVTKWDGAENTDVESIKGGLSNAMKRSAVQWGIGRYLYNLEATFANIGPNGSHRDAIKTEDGRKEWIKWDPPPLPKWAVPGKPKPKDESPEGRVAYEELKKFLGNKRVSDSISHDEFHKAIVWLDEMPMTVEAMADAKAKLEKRFEEDVVV